MSILARSAAPAARRALIRPRQQVRFSHGHGHEEYEHMPFDYKNKRVFGLKVATYLATGFSIPFVAAWYQLSKSGAGGDA
ncbi:hypothetical protein CERSUDRAFT_91843 [Gelatoporia subvermispora B]|uniref:Cytochrome c oxidase subunit 8, mitochondrial n=1 Tax=Ceriporiopsis subvermispora (strain B) TaxID=914234 RepID=M2R9I8_CERS8|nr:hypothetical protein CERSUDRAFT_91843 [Gelatoporia subvermispora B]